MSAPVAPVFVLAAPGVPVQTLAAAIGRHPAALDLPECNLPLVAVVDALLVEMTGIRATQAHGVLRGLAHLLGGEQTMAAVDMARRWLARRAHRPTVDVLREVVDLAAPRVLVLPVVAALFDPGAAARLTEAFPDARAVHLRMGPGALAARTATLPVAAAASLLGAVDASFLPAKPDARRLWLMAEEAVEAVAARLSGDHLWGVRVEDLAADPHGTLAGIAAWLGLAAGADEVAAMMRPERSPFAGPGPYGAHTGGDVLTMAALRDLVSAAAAQPLAPAEPTLRSDPALAPEVARRARNQGYG